MLYVVTNRHLIKEGSLYDVVERAAASGADIIILREKDLPYDSLLETALNIKKITDRFNIPLIINGIEDVAERVNAYGFHAGYEYFKNVVKKADLKYGVSVHNFNEAVEAEKSGADYIIAGHVFKTDCKPGLEGRGINFIKKICSSVSIPVIAIGGINESNVVDILDAGAEGAAVMSLAMRDESGRDISDLKEKIKWYKKTRQTKRQK